MALYDIQHYLFRLKNDPGMQRALLADPQSHLDGQPALDSEAREAILSKDLVSLWKMGVHPLLLVPLSRVFGMPPQQYRDLLAPHAQARSFSSTFEDRA